MPIPTTTTAYGASYATVETDPGGPAAIAARLYLAVLGRAHDGLGLADATAFLRAGNPPAALATRLAGSPEFAGRSASLGNADFVQSTYASTLGRAASQGDIDFYVNQIASGGSRAGVSAAIAASSESRQAFAAAYPGGIEVPNPFAITVARVYDAALGRAPDEAGLVFWRDKLASGELTTAGLSDVLAGSAEFTQRNAGLSSAQVVASVYEEALGRTPSASEVNYYASRLDSGALTRGGLVLAFAEAPEQQASFARSVDEGVNERPPATEPPVTEPPVTEPPVTEPPVTQPPVANTAPVAASASTTATVAENAAGAVIAAVGITDADAGDALTYATSDPTRFEVVDGSLKLRAGVALDFEAATTAAVTVTATDRAGASATRDFAITVTNVFEQRPVSSGPQSVSVRENASSADLGTIATARFTDADAGDTLTYAVTTTTNNGGNPADFPPSSFVVDSSGNLRLAPDASFDFETASLVTVTVTATDRGGLTATQNIAITVEDRNDGAFGVNVVPATVAENSQGGTVIGALSAQDADRDTANQTFTFTVPSNDPNFAVSGSDLIVKQGAILDFETLSAIPITVTATNGVGDTTSGTLTINVSNVGPTAVADRYNAVAGTVLTVDGTRGVLSNDAPATGLTADAGTLNGSAGGTLNLRADGSFDYTQQPGALSGTVDTFRYEVRDAAAELASASVSITIG